MESAVLQNNYLKKLLLYRGIADIPPVSTEYELSANEEERECLSCSFIYLME
jgi:hypothetical protein